MNYIASTVSVSVETQYPCRLLCLVISQQGQLATRLKNNTTSQVRFKAGLRKDDKSSINECNKLLLKCIPDLENKVLTLH